MQAKGLKIDQFTIYYLKVTSEWFSMKTESNREVNSYTYAQSTYSVEGTTHFHYHRSR